MSLKHPLAALLLILLLAGLACNLPLTPRPTPTALPPVEPTTAAPGLPTEPPPATLTPAIEPSAPPTLAYQPAFEPAACMFPVPPGYGPECGYLRVPENRARLDSPTIRLPVAIFRSRAMQPAPDPVVHLAGGPGSSSLEVAGYLLSTGLDAVLDRRDLILIDQRGTGWAQPRLDCPERSAITAEILSGTLTRPQQAEVIVAAFRRCRDRLQAEGIDLAAYTSAASAADLADLRVALGLPPFNLYAVSYGTRLALTILRDHPAALRSAVLDSAYPPQVNLYTELAPNAQRAFDVFFSEHPGLDEEFYALVERLNAQPLPVSLTTSSGEVTISVDGGLLIDVLFVGLYNPQVTARMPEMIRAVAQGEPALLRGRLALYFDDSSALGMQMAVQCGEEIPFSRPEEAFELAQGLRPALADFFPASVQPLFAACRDWPAAPRDPLENQPVQAALPALVLAGTRDPITPPEWGRAVAADLTGASFYEFAGQGHWVTRSSPCALSLALAFWDDPSAPLDSSCLP